MNYRSSLRALLFLAVMGVAPTSALAQQYSETYKSIANGISSASGQAFIDLSSGEGQTTVTTSPSKGGKSKTTR